MRREGLFLIVTLSLILLFGANFYHFFNVFALFILAGGIAGTPLSISSGIMFAVSTGALLFLLLWPFREHIPLEKLHFPKKLHKPANAQQRRTR